MECVVFNEIVKRLEELEKRVDQLSDNYNQSDWYNVEEVCKKYHLPIHCIKSRRWRIENNFPTFQDGVYCRVIFKGSLVEKWIEEHYL